MNEALFQDLTNTAECVHHRLDEILTFAEGQSTDHRPRTLVAAMRHGVLNGGKRIRPFLLIQSAALFDVPADRAMNTACALECLHSYSLIHDDLPAMDDDDLRRGQPTVHKAFDEATAILAGDALLTLAFELIARPHPDNSAEVQLEISNLLAKAAGQAGMVGGQILDIAAEQQTPTDEEIRRLQSMKTGALIRFACEAGAVLGHANENQRESLVHYGKTIGLAFQLADDLLDITSDQDTMGKAVNKDADQGKGTLVGLHGVDTVQAMLDEAVDEAINSLSDFGQEAERLRHAARYIAKRKN